MKPLMLLVALLLGLLSHIQSQNTDLPGPTANLRSLPLNSYIIAMDNTYQLNGSGLFNLNAYGLVVYLLNNNVKVKWVITAGKVKDAMDFRVFSDRIKPTIQPPVSRTYKAGPFVIFAADTAGVGALIDAFYSTSGLTGGDQPIVYRSQAAVTVDVRYDLTGFKPTAAILTDGGNQALQLAYMSAASIPSANYTTADGQTLLSHCYTFASEPHNSNTGPSVDAAIQNIRTFVTSGGDFLGQCAAISNYENNTYGRFQTTTGITVLNNAIGTSLLFPNPDLSYSQFEGAFNGSIRGAVQNWQITNAGINNEHNHVTGTGADAATIACSVSKLISGKGGLVFYLGNHDYSTADVQNINGIRMYMNAFMTPAFQVCPVVLPLTLVSFEGSLQNGISQLQWVISKSLDLDHFNVQKSTDGANFTTIGHVSMAQSKDLQSYSFPDSAILNGTAYYRLEMVGKNDYTTYSRIISLANNQPAITEKITIVPNPLGSTLTFNFTSSSSGANEVNIYNVNGVKVFSTQIALQKGNNQVSLALNPNIANGLYFLEMINSKERITAEFLKK